MENLCFAGHDKDNPLYLLGQYSDDEVNDDVATELEIKVEELVANDAKVT